MSGDVWTRQGWILVFGILVLDVGGLVAAWLWVRVRSRRQRVR